MTTIIMKAVTYKGGKMKRIDQIAIALLIFAGLIWGLWGLFEFNLVYYIFGRDWIDRVVYFIMGAAAVYVAVIWRHLWLNWRSPAKKRK